MNGSGDVTTQRSTVPPAHRGVLVTTRVHQSQHFSFTLVVLKLTYSTRSTWSTSHLPPQHSSSTTAKTTAIEVTSAPEERRSHTGSKTPGRAIQ